MLLEMALSIDVVRVSPEWGLASLSLPGFVCVCPTGGFLVSPYPGEQC